MAVNPTNWRSGTSGDSTNRVWLACLIVASLVLLLVSYSDATLSRIIRTGIAEVSAPALRWLSAPVAEFRSKVSNAGSYAYLLDEVARLRNENRRLQALGATIVGLESRLMHYEELLKARPAPQTKAVVTTRILADSSSPFVKTALIDAGSQHGVRKGYAVTDAHGLIGQTVTVGPTSSRVLLLNDLNSRVPIRIEPAGYRAILAGNNTDKPRLEFLPLGSVLRAGNRVVTSGHGGMFPAGLSVGTVEAVEGTVGAFRVVLDAPTEFVETVRVLEPVIFGDPDEPGEEADPAEPDDFDALIEPDTVELYDEEESEGQTASQPDTSAMVLNPGARGPAQEAQN